jgi:hypothetical protein
LGDRHQNGKCAHARESNAIVGLSYLSAVERGSSTSDQCDLNVTKLQVLYNNMIQPIQFIRAVACASGALLSSAGEETFAQSFIRNAVKACVTKLPAMKNVLSNGWIGGEVTPFALDDLMGEMTLALSLSKVVYPMADALVRHFAHFADAHLSAPSDRLRLGRWRALGTCVRLYQVTSDVNNVRRPVVHCDFHSAVERKVSDLVLSHALELDQAAAECLGLSSASATKQWSTFKCSAAATPAPVVKIHDEIV